MRAPDKISFSQSPSIAVSTPLSPNGAHMERNVMFPEAYLSRVPSYGALPPNGGIIYGCWPQSPMQRKAYIQQGSAWFPKGVVYDTAISTAVPCSLQHATFHLGLGRPEPH